MTPATQIRKLSPMMYLTTLPWVAPMARRIPISRVRSMIVVYIYIASSTTMKEMTTAMLVKASLNCLRPTTFCCMTFDTCAIGVNL